MKPSPTPRTRLRAALATVALSALIAATGHAAPAGGPMANPDFTQGGKIPEGANHDWNLGTTGARGWMFSERLETSAARQIAITRVDPGSPADGVLAPGDVILGVGGTPFSSDPRTAFGKALSAAESTAGGGNLKLTRWRGGKQEEIVVKLPVLGSYGDTAPYRCPKSGRIFELGCQALAERMADPSYPRRQNPITRSLNALALLASGNPEFLPLVRRESEWAAGYSADNFQTWHYAYVIMLLGEYHLATGDDSVLSGLKRLALDAAKGQSIVGSWGHKFAGPDGRLVGYGMMNAPGVPLTISLVIARAAGIKDPAIDLAIERSARMLRFYIGKGAVPYGDHNPWTETHEDNGKCGMTAVLFNLLGEKPGAEFFSRMSVASHGPERDGGHTGNFTNLLWAIPGVAQAGPHATGAWMKEFGAWYFDLARSWDHSFPHQGPPEPKRDSYPGWDATGSYLLAYAMPLKKILLTGKRPGIAPQLDAQAANALILDGRGWSNNNRFAAYDALTPDDLLQALGSWSPVVRERAAMAISRRPGEKPVAALIKRLDSPSLDARYGACEALSRIKAAAAPAVPTLRKLLAHQDLWLRIKAAEALSSIGDPAREALPDLLRLLTQVDPKTDPRGMQQRYLAYTLFARNGMLGRSLDGVDREALYQAVRAGLRNEDGRARGAIGSVYRNLTVDEIKPLLPDVLRAVVEPAPSGIMFADEIRMEGLAVLAKHRIEEGIQACVDYAANQNPWASEKRINRLMETLVTYGAAAKPVVPQLQQLAATLDQGEKDFPARLSREKAEAIRNAAAAIEASSDQPDLIRIR